MRAAALTALLAATAALTAAPQPADRARADLGELERKLHRTWAGAAEGRLTLRADGAFDWVGRCQGVPIDSSGVWAVRWDALPPTLRLTFQASENEDEVGRTWETAVTRLDDKGFEFRRGDEVMTFRPHARMK